jgi:hypothetical protein
MAFSVRGLSGLSTAQAKEKLEASLTYLRRSDLARQIIDELEQHADVCVDVDLECESMFYAHPESSYDTTTSGGTVLWNPRMNLQTMDSANQRPNQPWVPQKNERVKTTVQKRGLSKFVSRKLNLSPTRTKRENRPVRRFGTLSTHMCLMHELGHALQYANYPAEFLQIKADARGMDACRGKMHEQSSLEETNLACVEIPIALELAALGYDETPRWIYEHTGGADKWK